MDITQLTIALAAGVQTFFSPCAFALLPAYISYYIGQKKEKKTINGIKLGLTASLGFASIIILLATLTYLIGQQIKQLFTEILPIIGIALIIIGITWALNKKILTLSKINIKFPRSSSYLFGAAYAVAAITCMFPVYLSILFPTINQGIIEVTLTYLAYLIGMTTMMTIVTLASTLSNQLLIDYIKNYMNYVTRISGIIIMASGLYLLINYQTLI